MWPPLPWQCPHLASKSYQLLASLSNLLVIPYQNKTSGKPLYPKIYCSTVGWAGSGNLNVDLGLFVKLKLFSLETFFYFQNGFCKMATYILKTSSCMINMVIRFSRLSKWQ